ncbi:MAG: polysaccharide deacetylase family protein [Kiritimatiellae bacterium]|nr:polysaccharide deacetylase family protein [Kiritimatiellia bacterium]
MLKRMNFCIASAGIVLVTGVFRVRADYECPPSCLAPDCVCAQTAPPGGFAARDMPQIMLLTFDDSVSTDVYQQVRQIFTNHVNPNGQPVKGSFFVSLDAVVDYRSIQKLHAQGHEIAVHTMTHSTTTNTTLKVFREEIVGCRRTLSELAQIPPEEIAGFRAPYLMYNEASFHVLQEQGFAYDASIIERPGLLSSGPSSLIWPYTLDNGPAQSVQPAISHYPGLFEIPVWSLFDTNGIVLPDAMDPPDEYEACMQSLKYTFLQRYTGNRAPMGLFLHAQNTNQWLQRNPWAVDAINEFMEWTATNYEYVWWVSVGDLAAFMRNPTNAAGCLSYAPFQTVTHAIPPDEDVTRCVYTNGLVSTCADCPPAYPSPGTVYVDFGVMTGGVLGVQVSTAEYARIRVDLMVSNNLAVDAASWHVVIHTRTNRQVVGKYGGLYTIRQLSDVQEIVIEPALWMRPLYSGENETNVYFVLDGLETNDVQCFSFSLLQLVPQRPRILGAACNDAGEVVLSWDDSAYGYAIESSDNLSAQNWATNSQAEALFGTRTWTTRQEEAWQVFRMNALP